ncbi:unnamed protein product [Medioppia subpectinata]|uniref:EB domain-containing protein n=1 Tax=Medioppia subpectinata TaxID=1979941 RepID=A0A7R9KYH6_9ACAR|nr:unnamed protein product [Medioppia subpectinata]CAG2111052.1 unnamed protein product [Medioppia subpectinata]
MSYTQQSTCYYNSDCNDGNHQGTSHTVCVNFGCYCEPNYIYNNQTLKCEKYDCNTNSTTKKYCYPNHDINRHCDSHKGCAYDFDNYYTYSYNGFWYWAWIFIIVPIIVCTCIGICVRRRRELARQSHPQFIITQPQYMTANGPPLYDPPPNYFMTTATGVQQQPKCVLSSLIIASIACVEPKVAPTRLGDDQKVQDYCSLTTTCEDNLTVCIDHSCYCGPNYYYNKADDECLYYDCSKSDRSVCPSFHDISRLCVSGQCVCDDETEPDVKNGGKCLPKRSGSGNGGDGISVWAWVWVVIIIPTIIGVSLVWYVRLRRRAKQKANKSTALTVSKH